MSSDTSWIRNEQETRTNLILPKLDEAGWRKEGARIREEVPISIGRLMGHNNQRATKLDADYVLEYKNTQRLKSLFCDEPPDCVFNFFIYSKYAFSLFI